MANGLVIEVNGQQFSITAREASIGRGAGNRINLSDSEASRRHASVWLNQGIPYIRDLGSKNGTYVNDRQIDREQPLRVGDRIKIGNTFLTVRMGIATAGESSNLGIVIAGIAGVALVVVIGALFLLTRSTASPAAYAGVYLGETNGPPYAQVESGTMVQARGFLLTRAAPLGATGCAPGLVVGMPVVIGEISAVERPPEQFYIATVICTDPGADLALLQVAATPTGGPLPPDVRFATVPIGNSDSLDVGDKLTIIGFSGQGARATVPVPVTVKSGVVAGFIPGPQGIRTWMSSNIVLEPGMTGGMAINAQGQLVGIPIDPANVPGGTCTPSCLVPISSAPVRGLLSRVPGP
ncbi:MAG: FHA domain-containing protein [Chloroflexota bacterium]|nr:FHA domain-containing protein [Chloroflexota bacterium]